MIFHINSNFLKRIRYSNGHQNCMFWGFYKGLGSIWGSSELQTCIWNPWIVSINRNIRVAKKDGSWMLTTRIEFNLLSITPWNLTLFLFCDVNLTLSFITSKTFSYSIHNVELKILLPQWSHFLGALALLREKAGPLLFANPLARTKKLDHI